jgi:hypothetical protein
MSLSEERQTLGLYEVSGPQSIEVHPACQPRGIDTHFMPARLQIPIHKFPYDLSQSIEKVEGHVRTR